jgi:alkaline phosphatase D
MTLPSDQPPPRVDGNDHAGINRRQFLALGGALPWLGSAAAAQSAPLADAPVRLNLPGLAGRDQWRFAFGSCAKQSKPQPIWQAIAAAKPDLFAFLGDNLYADAKTPEELRQRYEEFRAVAPLQDFRRKFPHIAIWDDHDFGDDDVGGDYPHKRVSQQLFCDAWNEPADSPRRTRDGVYQSYRIEADGKVVQVIVPDLRFNRTALVSDASRKTGYEMMMIRARLGFKDEVPGWYVPNPDPAATMLGEAQWRWLEAQLRQPADLRILASSVQLAAEGTGWECWHNFTRDRQRLAALIRSTRAEGLLVISGDMHYGEFSRLEVPGNYPLWDATSSGLTEVWAVPTPNARRASKVVIEPNFGLLDIDWRKRAVRMAICGGDGGTRIEQSVALDQLRLPAG